MALLGAPAASLDQDGQPYGYNPAFATEIASRLSLQPVIQQQNFDELISTLQTHTCDISVSSQNITSDRSALVNLIPYTQSKAGFPVVVAQGNPQAIASLTDLCGQKVSAAKGTTNVDAVTGVGQYQGDGINFSCEQANAPDVQLMTYDTELDAVQALLDGTVVAYLGNSNYVSQYPDLIQESTATLPASEQGVAVALDHPALTAAVQVALDEMISDGTYLQILRLYLPAQSVDNFSIIEAP
jgi:polar amino acid transport system substrate-binding protein